MLITPLSTVAQGSCVRVYKIIPTKPKDPITQRLHDLGFSDGESLEVIASTPFAKGPIVVKIKQTSAIPRRFALRHSEAARILVTQKTTL